MFANIYGTNSITIPADMDMSEDFNNSREPISPAGSNGSSFQPSSIESNQQFNNYFSQSVPSYHPHHHYNNQQQHSPTPTNGLFPQLGSTLPENNQQFFAATPNHSSPSPHHTTNNAGAMSFEDLLTMYYVNGNQQTAAAAAAAAAVAIQGTSDNGLIINSNHSNVEAPSLSHLSTSFPQLPQSQGTI
jgi:GATA-binding protein